MNKRLLTLLLCSTLLVLVGCGGGGSDSSTSTTTPSRFTQLVAFGDSLSDSGAYQVGTVDAVGGGRFTVNSATSKVWVENVAISLGFANACTAQMGLPYVLRAAQDQGFHGAPLAEFTACTNYAQGAARVNNAVSFDSYGMQQALINGGQPALAYNMAPLGKMATPVNLQMAKHLTRNPSGYTGRELVTVFIGANDLLLNLTAIGAAATGNAEGTYLYAQFIGWPTGVQTALYGLLGTSPSPTQLLAIALPAAESYMTAIAATLVENIQVQIVGRGARNIAVLNLPDVGLTPSMQSLGAYMSTTATDLTRVFNNKLAGDLLGIPRALLVDTFTQSRLQFADPSQFGLSNVTLMACATGVPPNNEFLNESSLGCSVATLNSGAGYEDITHFFYADSVHPTPYGHQLLSNYFMTKLNESNLGR